MEQHKEQQQHPKTIMATVYLKSHSGRTLLDPSNPVTGNSSLYQATPETIQRAIVELQQRGFTIEAQGITLSISVSAELFERVFGVSIQTKSHQELGQPAGLLIYRSTKPVMQIHGLEDLIEGVVLAVPAVPL